MKTKPKTRINNKATRITLAVTAFAAELSVTILAVKYLGAAILILNYSVAFFAFLFICNAECDAVYKIIILFLLLMFPIISTVAVIALAVSCRRVNNTDVPIVKTNFYGSEYFNCGEAFFADLTEKLTNAKSRIYLEYYIIKNGKIWESIKNILIKKAASNVDVCLNFDGIGCFEMPRKFKKWLKSHNIKCFCFNRLTVLPNLYANCRTHRKIAVIDQSVYIGGINLADEYATASSPFGVWKDCAARFDGEISNEYAKLFSMRNMGDFIFDSNLPSYNAELYFEYPMRGSVLANFMTELISCGSYVKISTPYFAPDYYFKQAVKHALLRGKRIQIYLPGVPDKKFVYRISMIFAEELGRSGAEIFIFKPGFLHSKLLLSDNVAMLGSGNADYRSFYLQFESGVITDCPALVSAVTKDFNLLQNESERMTFPPRRHLSKILFFIKKTIVYIVAPFV